MKSNKYTPGPWSIMNQGAYTLIYGPNGERVCKIMDNKEDANIIVATPYMLGVLEELWADPGDDHIRSSTWAKVKSAIARVKGEGGITQCI